MSHRYAQMLSPIALASARMMTPAITALTERACLDAAMVSGLVARGIDPTNARMVVDQIQGLGLHISPSLYAPAHVAEAALTGGAQLTAARVFGAQPSLLAFKAVTPGYEQLLAQPGIAGGISPAFGKATVPGVSPAFGKATVPGVSPAFGKATIPGVAGAPAMGIFGRDPFAQIGF